MINIIFDGKCKENGRSTRSFQSFKNNRDFDKTLKGDSEFSTFRHKT